MAAPDDFERIRHTRGERLPLPDHVHLGELGVWPHALRVAGIEGAELETALQILALGQQEVTKDRPQGRASNIRIPYHELGFHTGTYKMDAWRTVRALVAKDLLHISDPGEFSGTYRRPARVTLVMNKATAKAAHKLYGQEHHPRTPKPQTQRGERPRIHGAFTPIIERNGVRI
jgi:hypothetical protein